MGNRIDPGNRVEKKNTMQNQWSQSPIEYNTRTRTIFINMKMIKRKFMFFFLQMLGSFDEISLLLKTSSDFSLVLALSSRDGDNLLDLPMDYGKFSSIHKLCQYALYHLNDST